MNSLESSRSLVDQAYDVILDALCDGTLEAGMRVTQEDIAGRLNVSRQPVTHALAVLKAQGFLIQSGRQGLTVAAVEPSFFRAVYEFRSVVEALAVRLATPRLTPETVKHGRALIARGDEATASGNAAAVLKADMDFHSFIYDLSGNPLVADTMRLHWHHLRRAMRQVHKYPGKSLRVWREHERIFETMTQGDAKAAAELMQQHLDCAYARLAAGGSVDIE